MANRSSFTKVNSYTPDSFAEMFDLSPSQTSSAMRYQTLKMKANKTPSEIAEQSQIENSLQDYIISPERWNHFSDALTNMQLFIKDEVEGYINTKQTEYNTYLDTKKNEINTHATTKKQEVDNATQTFTTVTIPNSTSAIQTAKDGALASIEQKKDNIIAYMDSTTAGQIRNDIGIMGELSTTNKTSIVNAINELNAKEIDLTPIETQLNNHVEDKSNPHGVTASQVGSYTTEEVDDKIGLLQDDVATSSQTLTTHLADYTQYKTDTDLAISNKAKKATNEGTALAEQVLSAKGDGSFEFMDASGGAWEEIGKISLAQGSGVGLMKFSNISSDFKFIKVIATLTGDASSQGNDLYAYINDVRFISIPSFIVGYSSPANSIEFTFFPAIGVTPIKWSSKRILTSTYTALGGITSITDTINSFALAAGYNNSPVNKLIGEVSLYGVK